MNRIYEIYLFMDGTNLLPGPLFPIPLCRTHGRELKQLLKKNWHPPGAGLCVYNGSKTVDKCLFCEDPKEHERLLKSLLTIHQGPSHFK